MSLSRALIAGVALSMLGCWSAPGIGTHWRSFAVTPELGLIAFTSSPLLGSNSTVVVDPHPEFCCVLIVLSGRRGGLSGSRDEDVGRSTHSSFTFRTDIGEVSFEYSWERHNDIVDIAGARYSRSAGNLFVARYESTSHWTVQQLGTIRRVGAPTDALEEIQRRLPDDSLIASLSIAPGANNGIVQRP
jgi:hypothetical protein